VLASLSRQNAGDTAYDGAASLSANEQPEIAAPRTSRHQR
jgi:hypothetical protein